MTRRKKQDEQLDALSNSVSRLVQVFTTDLADLNAAVFQLSERLDDLEATAAPGLAADQTIQVDSYAADLASSAQDVTAAWDITENGAKVYSVGGRTAFEAVEALLMAALRDGHSDPAVLDLHVGFGDAQDEEGLPFDGLLTVAV